VFCKNSGHLFIHQKALGLLAFTFRTWLFAVILLCGINVAADNTAEGADEVVDLSGGGAAGMELAKELLWKNRKNRKIMKNDQNIPNGVCDTDSVHTDLVDGAVDGEEVDEVAAERVLGGETDLLALRLDVLDDLDGGVLDVGDVLAVAVLHQVAAGADDNVDTVNTGRDGQLGVAHVASDVGEDLGLEAEVADGLAVEARLLAGGGRGELDVVDAEGIEGLGDLDLGLGVEEGVGELLALTEGGLDDLELGDVA